VTEHDAMTVDTADDRPRCPGCDRPAVVTINRGHGDEAIFGCGHVEEVVGDD